MAELVILTCDFCKAFEMTPIEATDTVELVWKGKLRKWIVCDPHGNLFHQLDFVIERLLELDGEREPEESPVVEREEPPQLAEPEPPALEPPAPTEQELKLAELERKLAELQAEQAALTSVDESELSTPYVIPTATQEELLPPAPPPKRKEVPNDGRERVRCLECSDHRAIRSSGIRGHVREVHGMDLPEARLEGVGFKFKAEPVQGTLDKRMPSVICPREHRAGAAVPYWVPVANRSSHAAYHRVHVANVGYENPLKVPFAVRCKEHPECAQADGGLGYGFTDKHGFQTHLQKEKARRAKLAEQAAA